MSTITSYPAGVPCWVDTFQPDPEAAALFYGSLLGWTFDDPVAMAEGLTGEYRTARHDGRLVAGIAQAPAGFPSAVWTTYVAVEDVDETARRAAAAGGGRLVGPTTHGEDGRVALLTDPVGVAFGIWQARARRGAEQVNEPGAWTMSSLHTPARDTSEAFYGQLFGWTLEPVPGAPMAFWRLDGHVAGEAGQPMPRDVVAVLVRIGDGDPTLPHWTVALTVDDVDTTARHACKLGGAVLLAPTDTPGFRSAVIADPQDGVVAVTAPATMV
jgi:predicted enzyme related to lactoylglutathione lyase